MKRRERRAQLGQAAGFLRGLPHVTVAAPVITNFSMTNSLEILYGIDYTSYDALKPFRFLSGGRFQGPYDVIVDDIWARTGNGHHVGETVTILNHAFRICGIVENGKGGRRFIPIDTMGALTGSEGKATVDHISRATVPPTRRRSSRRSNRQGLQGYRVQPMEDIIALYTPSRFPGFDIALRVGDLDCRDRGFLVIFQTM